LIQESSVNQGCYYAAYMAYACSYVDFLMRPINKNHLDRLIFKMLPGRHTENYEVKNLAWLIVDSELDYVFNEFIKPFLPDSHAHLRCA
jgi:hypothetical protein